MAQSDYVDVAYFQFGQPGCELLAAAAHLLLRASRRNRSQNLAYALHRVFVALTDYLLAAVEIEHPRIDGAVYHHIALLRQVIVGVGRHQHQRLVYQPAVLVDGSIAGGTLHADDMVGRMVGNHLPPREIVVQTAVVEQHSAPLQRLEHERYGHRRADSLAEVAAAEHDGATGSEVARHAEERHHQRTEIAAARLGCRAEKFVQRHIDLRRRDKVCRHLQDTVALLAAVPASFAARRRRRLSRLTSNRRPIIAGGVSCSR